jgi:multicomponent Na+:H+ antiporter subunit A
MPLDLPIFLTLLLAALSPWWVAHWRRGFMVAGGLLHGVNFVFFLSLLASAGSGGTVAKTSRLNVFPTSLIEWSFAASAWGLLFATMITGIGLLVFFYALGYFGTSPKGNRFFASLLVFEAAMLGVVLADHAILLFLFWELTSVSSFFLIAYQHEDAKARWNALQALLITGLGGICLLAGFLLLGDAWGGFSLESWRNTALAGTAPPTAAVVLLLLGAATKSALFPFFFWLPNAMSAPTPVSSYLHSATMVKAGIFLIGALHPLFASSTVAMWALVVLGGITSVIGLVLGWAQTDLKKILAYTTLSILGMLALLLGMGTPEALKVAVLVMLGHACYKAGLFMAAGAVDKAAGTRDLRELGGLQATLPLLGIASLGLALSKSGFPPMLGFIGKEYAYKFGLTAPGPSHVLLAFLFIINTGLMALALRVAWTPFRSQAPGPTRSVKPVSPLMLAGPVVLAVASVLLGVFAPAKLSSAVSGAVSHIHGSEVEITLKLWHGFQPALFLSLLTLGCGWWIFRKTRATGTKNPVTLALESFERVYEGLYDGLMKGAASFSGWLQNGDLSAYLRCFFASVLLLVGYKWWVSGFSIIALPAGGLALPWVEGLMVPGMAVFIALAVFTRSRILALLALAVVGLGIAFIFARLGAPDLALTLLLVETFTVVLFIFIVRGLPKLRMISRLRARWLDGVLSLGVGTVMALLALKVQAVQTHPSISETLTEWSYSLAKGKNVVNVILVDFRALDTLGEIIVITLSAIGVYLLWSVRGTARPDKTGGSKP